MAQRVETTLIDDLDGSSAERTVRFGLDGARYEIDLSAANAARFTGSLERFVNAARLGKAVHSTPARRGQPASSRRVPVTVDSAQQRAIRKWARTHGYSVGDRGRISARIRDAYRDHAGRGTVPTTG